MAKNASNHFENLSKKNAFNPDNTNDAPHAPKTAIKKTIHVIPMHFVVI